MAINVENETEYGKLTYLGDGCYASFDGYQIWLHADRDGMTHRIAMDNSTYRALVSWVQNSKARMEELLTLASYVGPEK